MPEPTKNAPVAAGALDDASRMRTERGENGNSLVLAEQFLQALDGRPGQRWHFRAIDHRNGSVRTYDGTLAQHGESLLADNAAGHGVFAVVNEGGATDAEISRIRAVFADLDGAPLQPVEACTLSPHIIVETSPGKWHAYWLIDGLQLAEFRAVQRAIAGRFGSDTSVVNPSRVMRLPGFNHLKGEPFRSRVIRFVERPRYTAAQILAEFPPTAATATAAPGTGDPDGVIVDEEGTRHADLVAFTLRLARAGAARESIVAMVEAEQARGRWSRDMDDGEIAGAIDSALAKLASGEVKVEVDPWSVFGNAPLPVGAAPIPELLPPVNLWGLPSARIAPVRYAMQQLLPRGFMTLLGGHGGTGKSLLALTLCAHVACGKPWAGFATERGPVLYLSLEDGGELVRLRLRHIIAAYGLDADAVAQNLRVLDGTKHETALMIETGRNQLATTPTFDAFKSRLGDASLVVIDGASDAFYGDDNSKRQVTTFVRTLVRAKPDAAWVCLVHIDKAAARFGAAGNSFLGSVAWNNASRVRLALTRDGELAKLEQEKFNLGRRLQAPICLRVLEHGVPMVDAAAAMMDAEPDAEAVLRAITAAIADGVTVSAARTGPANAHAVLQNLPDLPERLRGQPGRARFWAAITELQREGNIGVEEYRNENRKARQKFIVNSGAPVQLTEPAQTGAQPAHPLRR